jgi:glycosyltransferase involved in cell wall biosynthesis
VITKRPRLLCLMQLPPPVHGAAVVNQTVANSKLLASLFELEVLPLAFAGSIKDIEHASVRKLARMLGISARLAYALVARRPDAVYFTLAPTRSAFYRDCLFIALMKLAGVPRIYHLHGKGIRPRLSAAWHRLLYTWAFRDAWVIHLSERVAADIEGLVPRDRVMIVPNGIAERNAPARAQRSGCTRLLFLSNMIESKGPLVLLEALGQLHARGVAFEATFAGAVSNADFLARFTAAIQRLGLERRARYVGPAYGEQKYRLFDEHDIFVFPTSNDAFPLVALEAMQAGMPVVTTDEGALAEIVEDGATGLLVPPRDPAALAERLAALIANPGLQRQMGARARARQEQRYTLAVFEQNLAAALMACTKRTASELAYSELSAEERHAHVG